MGWPGLHPLSQSLGPAHSDPQPDIWGGLWGLRASGLPGPGLWEGLPRVRGLRATGAQPGEGLFPSLPAAARVRVSWDGVGGATLWACSA